MERCLTITKELSNKKIYILFGELRDTQELPGYSEKIQQPMDFNKILIKLKDQSYHSPKEWYADMCLVFQNAIDYYTPDHPISMISKYGIEELYKAAIGINIETEEEWLKAVTEQTKKITKLVGSPPLVRSNKKVLKIKSRADQLPPPETDEIELYLEKLNYLGNDSNSKEDLYSILKEVGGIPPDQVKPPIDLEKLQPNVINSLLIYAKESG